MTVVKPKSTHPWNKSISVDVQAAKIRDRIRELEDQIRIINIEIKMNKNKLNELKVSNGKQ
jgi:DNA-binding Lrp family transcriptional regulator